MATVDKKFADELIAGNGFLARFPEEEESPDNPPAIKIIEYDNAWGSKAYGVVFKGDYDPGRYERPTKYVQNPRIIWERA